MATQMLTIDAFMTGEDEREFSRVTLEALPDVLFVDIDRWDSPVPWVRDSISDCVSRELCVAIVNKNITPWDYYCAHYVKKSAEGYYQGLHVGKGIIQFLRSRERDFHPGGLANGILIAIYDPEENPEMDAFVKAVYGLLKQGGKELYLIRPDTGVVSDTPETKFFAWPDAVRQYDMAGNHYLLNHELAYFTSRRDAQIPEELRKILRARFEALNHAGKKSG
ncbi:MAG: hypothetical protein LBI31_01435 [Zoogloeaceae bacterium]|jgi:hypothetical protein|nr:hypothetical protein [Zoogloeaceae bacterium]